MAASLSSHTSLQWTRTRDRATSAPHLAEDFFHSVTRPGTSFSRVIRGSRSFGSAVLGQSDVATRGTATFSRAINHACNTGLQSEHVHSSFILHQRVNGVQPSL